MNIAWNAEKYKSDFSFVHKYGEAVTELLESPTGSSIIDLGCGNGELSALLAQKGYEVTGIDASASQLKKAQENHPEIRFIQADATSLSVDRKVDAVFANAVFHWIDPDKQPKILRCIYDSLKSGGELVFEMGGFGNCKQIHNSLALQFNARGLEYNPKKYFPTIGEYSVLLENAGFTVKYALIFDRLTELRGEHGIADWITMFEGAALSALPNDETRRQAALSAEKTLRDKLFCNGKWYADYVRLRMRAVR